MGARYLHRSLDVMIPSLGPDGQVAFTAGLDTGGHAVVVGRW